MRFHYFLFFLLLTIIGIGSVGKNTKIPLFIIGEPIYPLAINDTSGKYGKFGVIWKDDFSQNSMSSKLIYVKF